MHKSSYDKVKKFKNNYLKRNEHEKPTVIDLGSQDINGSYRDLFESEYWNYIGVDMTPGENVDIVLKNPYYWKEVSSNSADVFVSGQAFEHIKYIWISMLELVRVLKPGGYGCIIVPSSGVEHRYPLDCWRIYPDGLVALADFAEVKICEATTQWEDQGYGDGSDQWHDSMLIFQKPNLGTIGRIAGRFRQRLKHKVLLMGLDY